MKVHRIITTIEVENDNSITSVELVRLNTTNIVTPLVVTNITTNGSTDDIEQAYNVIDIYRLGINHHLRGIVDIVNAGLNHHQNDEITDDNTITETNYDEIL